MNYNLQSKIYIRKNMKKALLIIAISLSFLSCKNEEAPQTPLSELKSEKDLILKKMDSLSLRLNKIEENINLLDKTKKLQKVTLLTAKDTLFKHYISLQGTVVSDRNLILHPEMGGTITKILVSEGQRVRAGQRLVQFDNQSVLDQMNEIQTQLDLATTTYERQKRLWDQKIGSEIQFLQTKNQKESLEKTLKSLQTQLGKMTLRAPYSGVIDEIFAKKGAMTSMQSPILRLVNLSKIYVETEVPEAYLKSIKKGTPVIVHFDALGKEIQSKIAEVGNYINPENRSFKIKINVPNSSSNIKPNLLAELKINDFSQKGIVIPKQVIQVNQKEEEFIYTITRDSLAKTRVRKILLTPLKEYNNEVLIDTDLKDGDEIVYEGGKFIKDGDEVLIVQ